MWTRALLKDNAKRALRSSYWRAFGVCFVLALLGVSVGSGVNLQAAYSAAGSAGGSGDVWTGNNVPEATVRSVLAGVPGFVWAFLGGAVFIGAVLTLCWNIFMTAPLQVGMCRYFMENRQSAAPFATVWTVFRTPYLNVVKVQLLVTLKVMLGMVLFIVPGVYWAFCYRMVPYLLAENPYLTPGRAMELSRQMMEGEKWRSYVLNLSFIGWYLLGSLLLGVGVLFVNPYCQATFAELYAALRAKAFALGLTDANELGGFVRYDPNP